MATKLRSAYRPHPPVQSVNELPTRTKGSMQAECDINNIVAKYNKTGIFTHFSANRGEYTDMPPTVDYQESLNLVITAQASFDALPSELRNRFHNDPALFLKFAENEDNHDEMIKMGMLPEDPVEEVEEPELPLEPEIPAETPTEA